MARKNPSEKQIEYWTKRAELNFTVGEKKGLELAKALKKNYEECIRQIEKEINAFYGKYAKDNKIEWKEAKKLLDKSELKSFKQDLQEYINELKKEGYPKEESQKLKNLYIKSRISRLEELKTNINFELDKLTKKNYTQMQGQFTEIYEEQYYKTIFDVDQNIGFLTTFTKPDTNLIEKAVSKNYNLANYSVGINKLWENTSYLQTILEQKIPQGLTLGYNPRKLARMVDKQLNTGYNATVRLIRTEYNTLQNEATFDGYKQCGLSQYQILATLDNRTSEICQEMDLEIFNLSEKEVGVNYPPFHPNCFDKETEVYTNNGWKLFKNLQDSDLIYTINPETLIPEFEKPIKYISYKYVGNMYHFYHKFYDLLVTPNHNMWLKYDGNGASGKFRFVEAQKIPKYNNKIYRSCNWIGIEPKTIKLGDYDIDIELYCKFMAYYLADGSYITRNENNRGYTVSISQKTYNELMYNELKELPINLCRTNDSIYFNDKSIYEYLQKFGRCNEKYIPDEIKKLSPKYIQIFLNAYAITDGYINKGSNWNGYQCKDNISYFTTSKKLADDLGELIMKCGKRPTFSKRNQAGNSCFNEKYKENYDLWIIYENTSVWSLTDNIKVETLDYNDYVYCVELSKYNTLLVRRNGQISWCGNCRTTTIPYFEPDEIDEEFGIGTRIAKDEDGKYIQIPADMNYKEYYEKYIKN